MKKYTVNEFLNFLKNKPAEIDELANWRTDAKFNPIKNENGELEGWKINGVPVLFTCGKEAKDFEIENPDLVARLKEQFGEDLHWEQGNLSKCKPRRAGMVLKKWPSGDEDQGGEEKSVDTGYKGPEKSLSQTTWIKKILNKQVTEILGTEEVSKKLERLSIPEIKPRERSHINRYGKLENDKIEYQTHNFNSYLSGNDFLKAVMARVAGKDIPVEYKSYHLARQFNKNYRKWDETKKNRKEYLGKTDVYKLEKFGFDPDNLDVTVRSDLKIFGQLIENENKYKWTVTLEVKFGKKLKDEYSIAGRLERLDDKMVTINKEAETEGKEFTDSYTVLHDISIVSALIEALTELKDIIIKDMKPIDMLPQATRKKEKIDESVVNQLTKRVVREIKN